MKGGKTEDYDNLYHRALETDLNLAPLLRGLTDPETAQDWLGKANEIDAPTEDKEAIAQRIRELQD